jgi:hypothetical protein
MKNKKNKFNITYCKYTSLEQIYYKNLNTYDKIKDKKVSISKYNKLKDKKVSISKLMKYFLFSKYIKEFNYNYITEEEFNLIYIINYEDFIKLHNRINKIVKLNNCKEINYKSFKNHYMKIIKETENYYKRSNKNYIDYFLNKNIDEKSFIDNEEENFNNILKSIKLKI